VIKHLITTALGFAYLACSVLVAAHEPHFAGVNTGQISGGMNQSLFVPARGIHNAMGPSTGASVYPSSGLPLVVLPVPLPAGVASTAGGYGFQYPGSYTPRDTPLHRFNGYVVCDPPNSPDSAATGTNPGPNPGSSANSTEKPTGKPATPRLVKITTTRSLASPGNLQPCPIYTIDGRVQKKSGYSTTISR
jgi:hypothetical protein